ncbi:hypothetical protein [Jiella mangrovi]|uniref:DNA breaking-rejoining protein n=1 Tax=Jiella mangrovi TaxID=2821407 RepID=A0ABS4BM36_9HYPH|nr:hypothetical protein [Jiella mangrovi]MBP0617788.1 hypothetical protein [Jiella mangrovi]
MMLSGKTVRRFCRLFVVCFLLVGSNALAQSRNRVSFSAGSDNASVSGRVIGKQYRDYILGARRGQAMAVSVIVDAGNGDGTAYFNVLPPGSSNEAIFNGSLDGSDASVSVLRDGNYTVGVYLMGNDADAGNSVEYRLLVTNM